MHDGDAGDGLAVENGPVDGGGPPVFGQQGRVDVDTALDGIVQNLRGQDLTVGRHHDELRVQLPEIPQCLPIPHLCGLEHGDFMGKGTYLYRTWQQLHSPVLGFVRLGKDATDSMPRSQKGIQRGHRKFRRTHKEDLHWPSSSSISSSSSWV